MFFASKVPFGGGCILGYCDYDVFLENDRGSRVYRCKKLFTFMFFKILSRFLQIGL